MMTGEGLDTLPAEVRAAGWKPSKKKGWKGLTKGSVVVYRPGTTRELLVAYVLYNDTEGENVQGHSCRSLWTGMQVVHKKEYHQTDELGQDISLSLIYRPFMSQNIVLRLSAAGLIPGKGHDDLYGKEAKKPYSVLFNLTLTY